MKCDEIFAALAMLEKERGIPQSFMTGKIIQALTTAYKRDHEGVEYVVVDVDEEKKDLKMYVQKEIVETVENPGSQISLEDARAMSAKYQLGGVVNIPVKNVEFGRIAAGNGKQVIIQGLREAEHGMIYDEWGSKQHEILTGTVSRIALNRVRYVAIFEGEPLEPAVPMEESGDGLAQFNWAAILLPLGVVFAVGGVIGACLFVKRRREFKEEDTE